MKATNKMSLSTKFMMVFSLLCIAVGFYKCVGSVFGSSSESSEASNEPLACETIKSWKSDQDIINSLQGTWVMENEDYYGKRKFQFSGNSGTCWKMDNGSNEWKEEGSITFESSSRYDSNTKRNVGTEYILSYKGPIGWFSFDVDCVSGISVPSERYTYGISLLKID